MQLWREFHEGDITRVELEESLALLVKMGTGTVQLPFSGKDYT